MGMNDVKFKYLMSWMTVKRKKNIIFLSLTGALLLPPEKKKSDILVNISTGTVAMPSSMVALCLSNVRTPLIQGILQTKAS